MKTENKIKALKYLHKLHYIDLSYVEWNKGVNFDLETDELISEANINIDKMTNGTSLWVGFMDEYDPKRLFIIPTCLWVVDNMIFMKSNAYGMEPVVFIFNIEKQKELHTFVISCHKEIKEAVETFDMLVGKNIRKQKLEKILK